MPSYARAAIKDPTTGKPDDNLLTELEDFRTALGYVRGLGFADKAIAIGGKSLGSLVSQRIFANESGVTALVLLTPVCTTPEGENLFASQYPGLESETRRVFLVQGRVDPSCKNEHFLEYLKGKRANFSSLTVEGDHGFGIKNSDGSYNNELGLKNLQAVAQYVFESLGKAIAEGAAKVKR